MKLTLFIFNDILKNEMWHPVRDEPWFVIYYLCVGKNEVLQKPVANESRSIQNLIVSGSRSIIQKQELIIDEKVCFIVPGWTKCNIYVTIFCHLRYSKVSGQGGIILFYNSRKVMLWANTRKERRIYIETQW